jgi:hypothetical protein
MYALDGMLFKIIHETFEFFPEGVELEHLSGIFENSKRSRPEAAKKRDARIFDFNRPWPLSSGYYGQLLLHQIRFVNFFISVPLRDIDTVTSRWSEARPP